MSTVSKGKKAPLLPPEEKFWVRYSPHHELPLAGATSFFIHGLVISLMVLAAFWYLIQRNSENNKPPSMDMVQLAGGGDGLEGKGGEPGAPGEPSPMSTEFVPSPLTNPREVTLETDSTLKDAAPVILDIPEVNLTDPKQDVESVLDKIEKEAADQAAKKNAPAQPKKAGTGNPKGVGGLGGSGGGPGRGNRGTGLGAGGPGGPKTKAEVYAARWQFNLSGLAKDHVVKFLAMGVKVAVLAPDGKYLFIQDLHRRPVELGPGTLPNSKDVVMWGNNLRESVERLADELKLPFVPTTAYAHLGRPAVVMFLPKDREQNLADEEMRFAQKAGRRSDQIVMTVFDFQLRGGRYEPMVVGQK